MHQEHLGLDIQKLNQNETNHIAMERLIKFIGMLLIIFLTQIQHPQVAHHAVNPGQRSLYMEGFLR